MARGSTTYTGPTDDKFEFNVKNPKDTPLPPSISAEAFNQSGRFDPETVISRTVSGQVLSRFQDTTWDFSTYLPTYAAFRIASFAENPALAQESKTILLLLICTPTKQARNFQRIINFAYLLLGVSKYCLVNKTSIKKLFRTKGGINVVSLARDAMASRALQLVQLSDFLAFMGAQMGFSHDFQPLSQGVKTMLRRISWDYQADVQQNPIIPSRIFRAIIDDTVTEYEALLPVLDELLAMQAEIDAHPMIGLSLARQKALSPQHCGISLGKLKTTYSTNLDLAKKYPLAREFLNLHFSSGLTNSQAMEIGFDVLYVRDDVLFALNYIQRLCQDMMIMFTGMRPGEAGILPYFGSKETTLNGVRYWLIYGFALKKQTDHPPFEMWVTNEYGYKSFQTAKRIADFYYHRNQRLPVSTIPDGDFTPDLSPLFLGSDGTLNRRSGTLKKSLCLRNGYIITQADFDELKMVDPHRIWEGRHKFAIGQPYPVQLKLFRRTVAFFASASGVSITALKRQGHWFDSLVFYYSQGSGRANPFLQNQDSFGSFFNKVRNEAEAFKIINDVIHFDGKLFGPAGQYAERNQAFYARIQEQDRSETVKLIKRGELAYKETHLGGCLTTEPCQNKALASVTACLTCKDGVIVPKKLARAIDGQAQFVDQLDPNRLEFRTEIGELTKMLDFAISSIEREKGSLDRRKKEYKNFSVWLKQFKRMRSAYGRKMNQALGSA